MVYWTQFIDIFILYCRGLMRLAIDKVSLSTMVNNLKKNWFLPISAVAFFCLNASLTLGYFIGILIAFIFSLIIFSKESSIWTLIKSEHIGVQVLVGLTAMGICWAGQERCYKMWSFSSQIQAIESMAPFSVDIPACMSVVGAVVAFIFVYYFVLQFWNNIKRIALTTKVFTGIRTAEVTIYIILLLIMLVLVTFAFLQTEAFYGTDHPYDIIYTSDSPSLVKGNVFLSLAHAENDIRQPLFAVFTAPFLGIPYLIGRLFGTSASVQAMLMNYAQIVLLFAANFMLTRVMKLTSMKRVCFMLLTCCTYTHLLFTLMMEQYIIAYFWLILCIYLICEKAQSKRIAFLGASGTLLTSIILLPLISKKAPLHNFKAWLLDTIRYGFEFIAVLLAFCRFDVIYYSMAKFYQFSKFTGKTVTFADKIHQYTGFIRNCFYAPNAGINHTAVDHVSWQMNSMTGVSIVGVVILALVIISAILNRDKISSLLAAGWVGYSIIMLFVLGWGTQENGLILYSLYFGWAFLVLLFQLVEKIESKLNLKFLLPIVSIGCAVTLAVVNIPAILDMVNFAITYYPV